MARDARWGNNEPALEYAPVIRETPPALRLWLKVCAAAGATSLLIPVLYHVALMGAGLKLMDLWGGGQAVARPLPPGTQPWVTWGHIVGYAGAVTGFTCVLLGVGVGFAGGAIYRSRRTAVAGVLTLVAGLAGVLMSLQIGFTLAGI